MPSEGGEADVEGKELAEALRAAEARHVQGLAVLRGEGRGLEAESFPQGGDVLGHAGVSLKSGSAASAVLGLPGASLS